MTNHNKMHFHFGKKEIRPSRILFLLWSVFLPFFLIAHQLNYFKKNRPYRVLEFCYLPKSIVNYKICYSSRKVSQNKNKQQKINEFLIYYSKAIKGYNTFCLAFLLIFIHVQQKFFVHAVERAKNLCTHRRSTTILYMEKC